MFTQVPLNLPSPQATGSAGDIESLRAQVAALAEDHRRLLAALVSDRVRLNQAGAIAIDSALIDGTPIGGTTAAAGAFTTLSASGLISANGGQIKFPATQSASADANTLDDYEEASWTPAGNGVTFSAATGQANKIGRFFIAHFDVTWPATADTGEARITGLPYTVANAGPAMGGFISYTDYGAVLARGVANTTYALLTSTVGAALTNANVSGKRFIGAVVSYV